MDENVRVASCRAGTAGDTLLSHAFDPECFNIVIAADMKRNHVEDDRSIALPLKNSRPVTGDRQVAEAVGGADFTSCIKGGMGVDPPLGKGG